MLIHSAVITGSVQFNNTDVSGITNVSSFATTASVDAVVIKTGSFATTSSVNELQSKTGSYTTTSSFSTYTSSNDGKVNAALAKTGSYATTGSNTFIGTNVFTGSVFITSDLIVQGSSSLQNITASAVSIGTNTVILNTNTPILQFGGISVQDSGSTAGRSGSLLWNSVNDHWINVNPSGSDEGYNSAMVINGPKNTGSLGAEVGLTTNYIPVSQGEDHITDSIIFQSGSTNIGIGTTTPAARLDVAGTSKFGTISANTHQFTGSVLMSGSHTVNGGIVTTGASAGYSINRRDTSAYAGGWYAPSSSILLDVSGLGTALAITSAGSVGINTSSPTTNVGLTVKRPTGTGWIIDALNSSNIRVGGFYSTGGSNGQLYLANSAGTETVILDSAGASYFSGGNVGIGTTSPSGSLHIVGTNATNRGQLSIQSNDTNNAARVSFYYHTTLQGNIGTTSGDFYSEAVNNYILYAGGSERMRIGSDGNVSFAKSQKHTGNRWHVVPFVVTKGIGAGTATSKTILEITSDTFNEYFVHINYGARLQNVSDSSTFVSSRMYGVNRFNSGAVAVTDSAIMAGSGGSINTHAPITAVASTSTKVIIKVDFSATTADSSFVWGEIRIFSYEGITPVTINNEM
jgi:hypothetical protein